MIDERLQELATRYAVGRLEGADKSAFEASLAANADLRALVDQLRETSAKLHLAASPPTLKSRVLEKAGTLSPPTAVRPLPSVLRTFLPWAIAACFALACVGIGQLYLSARAQRTLLRHETALANLELRSAHQQLEAERLLARRQLTDATAQLATTNSQLSALREKLQARDDLARLEVLALAPLPGESAAASAIVVWNPATQEGVLRVNHLPALASHQDYQLWVTDPAYPIPVDGGAFTVDPATGHARIPFRPRQPVTNATQFAVSLERKGGVPQAEGPILLLSD